VIKLIVQVVAVLAVLVAAPAAAQTLRSPYDFVQESQAAQAVAGYIVTNQGVLGLGPESGPAFGLGYGIRISGPFTFDARISLFPTSRTVYNVTPVDTATLRVDPRAGMVPIGTADLSLLLTDASLRFDITGPRTWYGVQPYALLGVGGVMRAASDASLEAELPTDIDLRARFQNGVTGHVGGGLEWHPSQRFSFRLDARNTLWRVHVPRGFIVTGRRVSDAEWVQNANLSVGGALRF
jgi:hypothetical protein